MLIESRIAKPCLSVMPRCSLSSCKDNANREQNRQATFERYAEMQLIFLQR